MSGSETARITSPITFQFAPLTPWAIHGEGTQEATILYLSKEEAGFDVDGTTRIEEGEKVLILDADGKEERPAGRNVAEGSYRTNTSAWSAGLTGTSGRASKNVWLPCIEACRMPGLVHSLSCACNRGMRGSPPTCGPLPREMGRMLSNGSPEHGSMRPEGESTHRQGRV